MQAIIFDLDGVIIDSEPVKIAAWKYTLDSYGVPGGDEFYIKRIGTPGLVIAAEAVKLFRLEQTVDEVMDRRESYYHDRRHTVPVIPETLTFLKSIPAEIPLGVASSAKREMITATLERLGIAKRFTAIVSGFDDGLPDKPDPAIYRKASELLKILPRDCVAIEDSQTGLDAAKRAGMFCVGLAARGQQLVADMIVTSLRALTLEELRKRHAQWVRKL